MGGNSWPVGRMLLPPCTGGANVATRVRPPSAGPFERDGSPNVALRDRWIGCSLTRRVAILSTRTPRFAQADQPGSCDEAMKHARWRWYPQLLVAMAFLVCQIILGSCVGNTASQGARERVVEMIESGELHVPEGLTRI